MEYQILKLELPTLFPTSFFFWHLDIRLYYRKKCNKIEQLQNTNKYIKINRKYVRQVNNSKGKNGKFYIIQ